MALGFWMNNKHCFGCATCAIACKSEKQLESGTLLRHLVTMTQNAPVPLISFVSVACNHCEHPACVINCPVQAYTKQENGLVTQNHTRCIGCKTCISACPFGAPSYDENESQVYKCDGCIDRQTQGLLPACVAACPAGNLAMGPMEDLQAAHPEALISSDAIKTHPSFAITPDPKLAGDPRDALLR